MTRLHRYILEPYKGMNTRYGCPAPNCGKGKTFSLYIDAETGEHIHPTVGRCNRESNCRHHYTPKQYFQDNNISFATPQYQAYKPRPATPQPKPVSFIPVEVFKASLKAHETNHFVQFLINLFGVEVTSQLVSRYFIATSKHWNGATVFWQIDTQGKVRTGKIMLYSPVTGKRVKEPFSHINWVHKALNESEFELQQCLFGQHLLIDKAKPVAVVESEKTAVIASVYLPQFIWVAVGSLTNLNAEKCSILKGRYVTLFPDLNGFDKWSRKAKELSHLATFTVSNLLEQKATEAERLNGFDLADYLVKLDWKLFRKQELIRPNDLISEKREAVEKPFYSDKEAEAVFRDTYAHTRKAELLPLIIHNHAENNLAGGRAISELITRIEGLPIPNEPIQLNQCSKIHDAQKFVHSHLNFLKRYPHKGAANAFFNRLQTLDSILNYKTINHETQQLCSH